VKPTTRAGSPPHAPYQRSDDFSARTLQPVWQWNHVPENGKWSLSERPGFLRLHSLPAQDLLAARNTLTQRAIGPRSTATIVLNTKGLRAGDVAGFALLTRPYGWIGVEHRAEGLFVTRFDEQQGSKTHVSLSVPLSTERVWLRAECDFLSEKQKFSYSTDGTTFTPLGRDFITAYQLITFQGVRYSLFAFNTAGGAGGFADFDSIRVDEPDRRGLKPIPYGRQVVFASAGGNGDAPDLSAPVRVVDRGLGRVSFERAGRVLTVQDDGRVSFAAQSPGPERPAQVWQWMETLSGEIVLMSLQTHRYLRVDSAGALSADNPGPAPNGKDGTRFSWRAVQ
jgi:hypothetical protein